MTESVVRVYDQLLELGNRCDTDVMDRALIAAKFHYEGYQATEEQHLELADRIYEVCISTDEPRFTWYDYADAIINWPRKLRVDRLLSLNSENFEEVITYMAYCKRETYSSGVCKKFRVEELLDKLELIAGPNPDGAVPRYSSRKDG